MRNPLRPPLGILIAMLLAAGTGAYAQSGGTSFDLTVASIMRGPELVGEGPSFVRWSADGRWLLFRWKPGGRPWQEDPATYRVLAAGGEPEKLTDAQADSLTVYTASGPLSPDRRWRAVSSGGDLFLLDTRGGPYRRLTATRAAETLPVWGRDSKRLYYIEDNNIYARDLSSGDVRQLTDVRTGPAPSEPAAAKGQRKFLEDQQRELFEHIRIEQAQEEERTAARKAREAREEVHPLYLEREERVGGLAIDPDGRYAVISTSRGGGGGGGGNAGQRVPIPYWVTESGYTETRDSRSKVGDAQSAAGRMGIVSLQTGEVRWLDVGEAVADSSKELASTRFAGWNDAGTRGLVTASSADFKDAWLWSLDAKTGALTPLAHDHDDAWVAGPCAFWRRCSGWLPDGEHAYYVSERTGFAHLYVVAASGGTPRALTSGEWEVQDVDVAPGKDRFYLTTNEGNPFEVHFYTMRLDGSGRVRVTAAAGRQDVTPSPDGKRLAIVHSYANVPPELYLADNRPDATMRRITTTPTAEWRAGPWIRPEIVRIEARDGVPVPARIYRPADLGARPNDAAVIFVHGAGYLQNVHNWWSDYYREYMFNHLLASRGYVVLDIDYRGSAGYGSDWRTAIYRHMGGKDLDDQVDGVRYLQREFGIDPEHVGIYGGSYGGFITLMALFTQPGSFGAGAALRSVTDWAHYNHGYTGPILNLPQSDSVAYRQSSPIYFAEGLEDPLLIAHGMVDTNVHFSDVVRLAQRLIELGKQNWTLAVYPVENHSFVEPASWTDEYRRILHLFETTINPGGRPEPVN